MRLAHVSDMHFGGEDAAAIEGAAAFLHRTPFDLLAISGDFTLVGAKAEFAAAKAWVDSLPGRKLFTPGNHDTPYHNVPYRLVAPWSRYRGAFGPVDGNSVRGDDWSVAAINTARGAQARLDWSKGAIGAQQVERAISQLGGAATRVAVCHHPLAEMIAAPVTGGVHGGEAAAARLAAAGVDLVLSGHVHVPFAAALAAGDGRTYAVGAGTLSRRLRGCPPSFNLIEIETGTITVTAQGWTGSHFEPWRTWSLERRA